MEQQFGRVISIDGKTTEAECEPSKHIQCTIEKISLEGTNHLDALVSRLAGLGSVIDQLYIDYVNWRAASSVFIIRYLLPELIKRGLITADTIIYIPVGQFGCTLKDMEEKVPELGIEDIHERDNPLFVATKKVATIGPYPNDRSYGIGYLSELRFENPFIKCKMVCAAVPQCIAMYRYVSLCVFFIPAHLLR